MNYTPYILFLHDLLIEMLDMLKTHELLPIQWVDNHKIIKIGFGAGSHQQVPYTGYYGSPTDPSLADDLELDGKSYLTL
jgi:hypothetical protein